jgi:mono/diheme cytochrome c family protein
MIIGKRLGVLLAILLLLSGGLVAACGGGDDADSGDDAGADDPAAAAAQALFVEVGCAECHGENGEGDGVNPRTNLVGTRMIISQFRTRVRNGKGSAKPPFTEEQISDEQIEQLHEWLRNMEPA